jgi:hypothetical protein
VLVLTADECLARFRAAVRDGRRGSYALAQQLVEGVRTRHGEQAAQIAKKELWNFIRSGKPA